VGVGLEGRRTRGDELAGLELGSWNLQVLGKKKEWGGEVGRRRTWRAAELANKPAARRLYAPLHSIGVYPVLLVLKKYNYRYM